MENSLSISLTEPQSKMFVAKSRIVGVVAGMGSGKTDGLIIKMISDLFKYKCNLLYAAPTFPLIREIFFPKVTNILSDLSVKFTINKTEGSVYTPYGKILTISMKEPERIVGFEVLKAYIDEVDIMQTDKAKLAFDKIAARLRSIPKDKTLRNDKNLHQIYLASTPEGYKFMYETFVKNPIEDSEFIQMSTYSNPYITPDYIENLKKQFPPNRIKAYLNGEFVNLEAGLVYYFDRDKHVIDSSKINSIGKYDKIYIGQDFNIGKTASTIAIKKKNSKNERVWLVIDEMTKTRDTTELIKKINSKYPHNNKIIYPDASGRNKTTSSMSKSDHSMLQDAGFALRTNKTNPLVKDRINAVNNALYNNKVFISSDCIELIDALSHQSYDKHGSPDKNNDLDHITDAFGYFISKEEPAFNSIARYNSIKHI